MNHGERKHETCRFGIFSRQAYSIDSSGRQTPHVVPLCAWKPDEDVPPHVHRYIGGAIDFERDCRDCTCHRPVEAEQ